MDFPLHQVTSLAYVSGTLHPGLISTNPEEESWQKVCHSLPPLGSIERPWKFIQSSVLTAPLAISMQSSQLCEGGKYYYSPAVEETEAKVVKDFVKLKNESSRKPIHQSSLGCCKRATRSPVSHAFPLGEQAPCLRSYLA